MSTKRFVVYPYSMTSKSGKYIANALEAFRVYPDRKYQPQKNDIIVNWGNGNPPNWPLDFKKQIINHWDNVCYAIDKRDSFRLMAKQGVRIPPFTENSSEALRWLHDGATVVGRSKVQGTRGKGIVLMKTPSDFVPCPLYTKYQKKLSEFRIYVFQNVVLDFLEKRRDSDRLNAGTVNEFIRTEEEGWVFCRQNVRIPDDVGKQAVNAVEALGLVFGGVDVIWNDTTRLAHVLEVNTAPGIWGTTVTKYATQIKEYAERL